MIFLDTNVLVPFLTARHPRHDQAREFVLSRADEGTVLLISPQIVGEAFRVLTSPAAVVRPLDPDHFHRTIMGLLRNSPIMVISPGRAAIEVALTAAAKLRISSARIFDLLIYGTMKEHGITRIATFNVKDFRDLDDIDLVPVQP